VFAISRYKASLSLIAAAACWGVATVISKRAVAEIPPLTLLPAQLLVSVAALASLVGAQRVKISWSPQVRRVAALGILNPGIAYALSLTGLSRITASLSVLLWALEPLLILALASALLGDRITPRLAMSSGIATAGVILVVLEAGTRGRLTGIVLTLAGVAACAVYTVISSKLIEIAPTLVIVTLQQSLALVFSLALLVATSSIGRSALVPVASARAWINAAVSGLLYYGVAFCFYIAGLRRVPAGVAGLFINLIPLFGITAGYVLLGERLSGRQWLGGFLIVIALAAAITHEQRMRAEPTTRAKSG
jgi:drug/metabolite transporter (DMT)-like permease